MNTNRWWGTESDSGRESDPFAEMGLPTVGLVPPLAANAALGCPILGLETDRRLFGRGAATPPYESPATYSDLPLIQNIRCALLTALVDLRSGSTKGTAPFAFPIATGLRSTSAGRCDGEGERGSREPLE